MLDTTANTRGAPRHLQLLPLRLFMNVALVDPDAVNQRMVDHDSSIFGDRADRVFGIAGRSDLAGDEYVEIAADPVTDRGGNRNSAAWYAEYERPYVSVDYIGLDDGRCEPDGRIRTVAVLHIRSVLATTCPLDEQRQEGRRRTLCAMRRLLLLANPSASGFTGALFRDVVVTLSESFDVVAEWPRGPEETREHAAAASANGYAVVAAMGGDGVVHHAANGVAGTTAALAIIPAGTTNVAARIFGLPKRPARAAEAIAALPAVPTRLARIESIGDGTTTVEYATFAVGVGFDADVVERADRRPHSKLRFGGFHYAESATSALLRDWRGRPANLRVDVEGDRIDGIAVLAQVHHPYTYFGRVPLHITREPVDGLAAVVAEDLKVRRAAEIFGRAVLRRPMSQRTGARVFESFERLVIDAEPPTPYQADGEHLGLSSHVEITPANGAILVVRDPRECCAESPE